ncbi:pentapeptide repeat-containing protein [Okeania sp.]|uniref:pentapeptide repeat-containing protein n=1 Tax=Okeania sp. TaxID=3100323 RepID=UPI002B4B851A|nr:pentapeptide repeat-containing protein [Okeania sp.]MEB3341229.1 pentapeptide repeat-containing protein [Okeania sp.]
MPNLKSNLSALMAKVAKLEKQQTISEKRYNTIKKYVLKLKNTLDEQIEKFNHRQEVETIEKLQKKLAILNLRLDKLLAENEAIISTQENQAISLDQNLANYEQHPNQLILDRSGSRTLLIEALEIVESRLILVCPWLNCNSIDKDLLSKIKACLDRACQVDVGWGYLGDRWNIGKGLKYNALADLQQLEKIYPALFRLKLLGTHENFIVCDAKFAFVGSHNFLASNDQGLEREIGIRTSDQQILRGLINRFYSAEVLSEAEINRRFTESVKNLENMENLPGVKDMNEIEFQDISIVVDEEDEQELESKEPVVSAKEFLQKYNAGERDFPGINLAGVDLSGKSFNDSKLNLTNANFNRANLSSASFKSVNLTGAKFRGTNLSEISFQFANLSQTQFINSNLNKAHLYNTKLEKTTFRNVHLNEANLESANFTEANLSGVNFSNSKISNNANFSSANLTKVNLSGLNLRSANFINANLTEVDLSRVNLLKANLKGAKLQIVKMNQALCSEATIFPEKFDYSKLGIYFFGPKVSLPGVNLAGSDLRGLDLSWADLREANLDGAKLDASDLKHANLSGASLQNASLIRATLITTNLTKADLRNAELNRANLRGADLISADLRAAEPSLADLSGANLTGAKLGGVSWENTKLTGAIMPDSSDQK